MCTECIQIGMSQSCGALEFFFFSLCILMWSSLFFFFPGKTSSRFICGSIQERSLICVHNVELPLLTTTTWRTTCVYTLACAPISAQAALRLLCVQITCTVTSRRTAAMVSLPVEAESLGCESQGFLRPPWACWTPALTQVLGLVPSGDGGGLKQPQQWR